MDGDGDHAKQLASDGGEFPSCSPDGQWVAYTLAVSGRNGIWKVPMEGGAPVQVTNENDVGERPAISPDGKLVACNYSFQENVLFVVPASAGIFVGQSCRLKAGLRTSFP